MSAFRTSIQKNLTGGYQRDLPSLKGASVGRYIYSIGSLRFELEEKFSKIMHEDLSLGSQVSYVGNRPIPFLRIYRYKEAFSLNFVNYFLKKFGASSEDYVFDPFSGLGTTAFTSMLNGVHSVGVDRLPIAYFASRTLPLFTLLNEGEVIDKWNAIMPSVNEKAPAIVASDVSIMKVAFESEVLLKLRKIKSAIDELPNPYHDILLLVFFSVLEECSLTSKDGQFLRLERDKVTSDPLRAIGIKIAQIEEDIRRFKLLYPKNVEAQRPMPDIYPGDTRDLSNIQFKKRPTILITSPPYANRYDYTRSYSLELCFHFVKSFDELKDLRFGILRSHIESKIEVGERSPHPAVTEVLDALGKKDLNNPKIPSMITTYFIDMQKVIREWFRVLAPGAKVAMVVDNVRFEGELIPVDLILSDMAEDAGFLVKEIIVARYKGNSSQQMRKYGKVPVRESVVVWQRHA
jgi:site-specific DNA-methyltransferase (cytosine-N4-specific)